MSPRMPGLQAWFVTGSQHLYGEDVLGASTSTPAPSPPASTRRPRCRSGSSRSRS